MMGGDVVLDKLITAAAAEVDEAMLRGLPEPEECRPAFSRRFEWKMKPVRWRADHPDAGRCMMRAAVLALVLMFGFSAFMGIMVPLPDEVYDWTREVGDGCITYKYKGMPSHTVWNATFEITGLGEEFEVEHASHNNGTHFEAYRSSDGDFLKFSYDTKGDSQGMLVVLESAIVEQVTVNGDPGDLLIAQSEAEDNAIVWCDRETRMIFYLAGTVEPEELLELAESVQRVKYGE